MMELDPVIVHYGQWGLFIATYIFGIWGTGYSLWASYQLGNQWYEWLDRRRRVAERKAEVDLEHWKQTKSMELEAQKARQAIELERERIQHAAMNEQFVQVAAESGVSTGARIKAVE